MFGHARRFAVFVEKPVDSGCQLSAKLFSRPDLLEALAS